MLKVGLIGCGGMGSIHAGCYKALTGQVQLVAAADVQPEKLQQFSDSPEIRLYSSGKELIEKEDLDFVDICVPTYLHASHAVMAMEKGMHVFMEKPACINEQEARLLTETKEKYGVKVQVGQVLRFWDEYAWLKKTVEEGTYGKVLSGVFTRVSNNPVWGWENWFNDVEKSGSVALDLHIHDVDFIRYLMGREPDSLSPKVVRDKDGVVQHILTDFHYGDVWLTAEGAWNDAPDFPFIMRYRVNLEKAFVMFDENGLCVYLKDGGVIKPEFTHEIDGSTGINIPSFGVYTELKYWMEEILCGTGKEVAPMEEGIASARLVWKELELAGGIKRCM